ncbi:MAG: hypothetical protein AAFQ98_13320 [Bacteroidota bacterium]
MKKLVSLSLVCALGIFLCGTLRAQAPLPEQEEPLLINMDHYDVVLRFDREMTKDQMEFQMLVLTLVDSKISVEAEWDDQGELSQLELLKNGLVRGYSTDPDELIVFFDRGEYQGFQIKDVAHSEE